MPNLCCCSNSSQVLHHFPGVETYLEKRCSSPSKRPHVGVGIHIIWTAIKIYDIYIYKRKKLHNHICVWSTHCTGAHLKEIERLVLGRVKCTPRRLSQTSCRPKGFAASSWWVDACHTSRIPSSSTIRLRKNNTSYHIGFNKEATVTWHTSVVPSNATEIWL